MLIDEYMLVTVDQSYIVNDETYASEEEADKACAEYNSKNPNSPVEVQYIGHIYC
jgi:hypothetical protein